MESEAAFLRAVNVADYNAIVEYIAANDPSSLRNENGLTALHLATMNNSRHILQLMVEHQINLRPESVPEWLNARTADGRTCLHIAARQGYLVTTSQNLSELLISFGADPHIRTEEGSSPIHYAALGNQPSLIAYLHEEIGLSAALCDYTGNTPLHYAAMEGSDLAVALLLMLARDQIDVGNAKGNRPLHLAAAGGQQRTTKLLMSQGADITVIVTSIQNSDLLTPRSLARQYYQESTAIALEQPAILSLCFKSGVPVLRPSFIPVSVFLVLTYYVAWVVALQWYWCCTAMLFVLYAIICCIDPGEVPQAPGAKLYVSATTATL